MYYPNLYSNYPQGVQNTYQQQYNYSPYNSASQPPSLNTQLNGKLVDTIDLVKITEVPLGGYGVFPKADLSEIYIKTWNIDGTTQIKTYLPQQIEETAQEEKNILLEKMNGLESKIDTIINNNNNSTQSRKEIKINEF